MIDNALRHLLDKMNVPPLSMRAARVRHLVGRVAFALVAAGVPAEDVRLTPSSEVPGLVYVSVGPPAVGSNTVPVDTGDPDDDDAEGDAGPGVTAGD